MLLLHGWTATADTTWFSVYPALAPDRTVLAVDHRGHGRGLRAESPFSLDECADDAAALLDLLGIKRVIVAGYSMGGAVAMLMWKRRPDLVAGLVLSATALEWRSRPRERVLCAHLSCWTWCCAPGVGTVWCSATSVRPWCTPPTSASSEHGWAVS